MNHVIKFALNGPVSEGHKEPMWVIDVGTHIGDDPPNKDNAKESAYFIPAKLPIAHVVEKIIPAIIARQLLPFAKLLEHDHKPKTEIPGKQNRFLGPS